MSADVPASRDESERFVSVRDYFDRIDAGNQEAISEARRLAEKMAREAREHIQNIFEEHRHAHVQKHSDDATALERAREHLAGIFEAHRLAHDQKHHDDEKAIQASREALDERLKTLNELRREVVEDRAHYVRNDIFETRVNATEQRVESRAGANAQRIERLEQFRNRADADYLTTQRFNGILEEWTRWRQDTDHFRSRALGFGALVALLAGIAGAIIERAFG